MNKAVSCQGCPKSRQPAHKVLPSVHSCGKCRKCTWESPREIGSLPSLLVSSSLKVLQLAEIFRLQNVKQGKSMFFSVRELHYLHLQIFLHGRKITSQKQMAGVLWNLTFSWYFNIFSSSMGPSLTEFISILKHQRLVFQAKISTCSSKIQVSLSIKPPKEHLPVQVRSVRHEVC